MIDFFHLTYGPKLVSDDKYWNKVADHIATVVETRRIEEVLHFTRLDNLHSILEHGILTRSEIFTGNFNTYASDTNRLDQDDDAVSVSITCFYPRMFGGKMSRTAGEAWVIVVLKPNVLWEHICLFYTRGAASNETKHANHKRYGGYALQKLFDDYSPQMNSNGTGFRAEHGLPDNWPTFPDSEVQVKSSIHPRYIKGVVVQTPEDGESAHAAFKQAGRGECSVLVQPFTPRIGHKSFYWG